LIELEALETKQMLNKSYLKVLENSFFLSLNKLELG